MHIAPFGVEIWMNEFEKKCELNLAETCVESITMAQLLALCGKDTDSLEEILSFKMTYGEIEGSDRLRDAISNLYEKQKRENILVTLGTIGANSLVHQALISRDDKVISVIQQGIQLRFGDLRSICATKDTYQRNHHTCILSASFNSIDNRFDYPCGI